WSPSCPRRAAPVRRCPRAAAWAAWTSKVQPHQDLRNPGSDAGVFVWAAPPPPSFRRAPIWREPGPTGLSTLPAVQCSSSAMEHPSASAPRKIPEAMPHPFDGEPCRGISLEMVLHQQPDVAPPWQKRRAQAAVGKQRPAAMLGQHADGLMRLDHGADDADIV